MTEWYAAWEGVLTLHKDWFINRKNSCQNLLRQIHNEIVTIHHTREDPEDLPKGLKKAIWWYYLQFLIDADDQHDEQEILGDDSELEEELGMSHEDREFQQEMDDYDKKQQQKKGIHHSIKYRTGHAREWFNSMTSAHQKEVEEVRDKWNREGTPAESQKFKSRGLAAHQEACRRDATWMQEDLERQNARAAARAHTELLNPQSCPILHQSQRPGMSQGFCAAPAACEPTFDDLKYAHLDELGGLSNDHVLPPAIQQDDIRTEYNPHSGIPTKTDHFADFHCNIAAPSLAPC
ncbi:hypothetical protein BD769DRAFT_1664924 [Suillus cothurnatus]|nr:hypothetical protein BD769DRAFT_1664924 [Suillus cothurnatus]